jgi:hypothetical protein
MNTTENGYTRLQFAAFIRRTIPDFREADMHSTADDYETALQFITADTMVMHDARKAMLAASSHTPAGSNAAALIAASLKDLDAVLGQSPIAKQESTQAPARRCLEDRSHLKD